MAIQPVQWGVGQVHGQARYVLPYPAFLFLSGLRNSRLCSAGLPSAADPGLAPPMAFRAKPMTQMRCRWRASLMPLRPVQLARIVLQTETDASQTGKDHANFWPYPCSSCGGGIDSDAATSWPWEERSNVLPCHVYLAEMHVA